LIIFNYLTRQVMVTMLSVTCILLLIFMSGRFTIFLHQAISGGISLDILLPVMAYRLPSFLQLILPLGLFIGILLTYGRMYLESEMTVLHACGLSTNRLIGMTLVMSAFVALLAGFSSLYLAPWGMEETEKLLLEQSKKTKFEMIFTGQFQHFRSNSGVIYIGSLSKDKQSMYDIFISIKTNDSESTTQIFASSGTKTSNEDGQGFLILNNGTLYRGNPGALNYQSINFDTYKFKLEEQDVGKRGVKDDAIRSTTLFAANDLKSKALLQWRISLALLVPIVALLAVSVSRVNPRQGRFIHLFPAMLIYVAYLGLLIAARKSVINNQLPAEIGLWSVHLLFFSLAMVLLLKERWLKWFK